MRTYFPGSFPFDEDLIFYGRLKKYVIEWGEMLEDDDPDPEKLSKHEKDQLFFLTYNKPMNFRPTDDNNCIVEIDRGFGILCAILESNGTTHASQRTCFEFYSKLDYLRKSAAQV